jgi:hypothetical protein
MKRLVGLGALALCTLLCGCQGTVVEKLPAGSVRECPPEWGGAWIAQDEDGRDAAGGGMLVDRDCNASVISIDAKKVSKTTVMHPKFFEADGIKYVLFEHGEVAEFLDWKDGDSDRPIAGYWPFHWLLDADRLSLEAPEHRRIATWIVQGALDGSTHWSSKNDGWNVIGGDEQAVARLLREHADLFDSNKPLRLRRVGADRAALDAALKRAERDEAKRDAKARKANTR